MAAIDLPADAQLDLLDRYSEYRDVRHARVRRGVGSARDLAELARAIRRVERRYGVGRPLDAELGRLGADLRPTDLLNRLERI